MESSASAGRAASAVLDCRRRGRFYRAPAARGMPGAGLGLAIVGNVAQANGGTIEVRTGPDGSTFTLAFPPDPPAAEVVPREQE